MSTIALVIIAMHMLGDYVTQNNWMSANKIWRHRYPHKNVNTGKPCKICRVSENFWYSFYARSIHVTIYTAGFVLVPIAAGMSWIDPSGWQDSAWLFLAAVFIPHWITDCRRWASAEPWPPKPIMVDQAIHACCLAAAAWSFGL